MSLFSNAHPARFRFLPRGPAFSLREARAPRVPAVPRLFEAVRYQPPVPPDVPPDVSPPVPPLEPLVEELAVVEAVSSSP